MRGESDQMARFGAVVAAWLIASPVLSGCGTGGNTGNLLNSSPLDLFRTSPKATSGGTADTGPLIDTQYDCPEVKTRYGAATLIIGSKPGEGQPNALDVRYQGSITRLARECHLNGSVMTMKVGIEGRIIMGPAGGPGVIDVPLRIAVVHEGPNPQTVASKFARENVTIASADRANFTHIDPDVTFPLPNPVTAISNYVIYVGFDPLGERPKIKKKPAPRHRTRPARPRSS
jgi:hypothetical protein